MASKELIEKVARAMLDAERKSMDLPHRVFHTPADRESVAPMVQAAISTILAALQEPTEEMRLAAAWDMDNPRSIGSEERMNAIIVAAINASPLGEQSE